MFFEPSFFLDFFTFLPDFFSVFSESLITSFLISMFNVSFLWDFFSVFLERFSESFLAAFFSAFSECFSNCSLGDSFVTASFLVTSFFTTCFLAFSESLLFFVAASIPLSSFSTEFFSATFFAPGTFFATATFFSTTTTPHVNNLNKETMNIYFHGLRESYGRFYLDLSLNFLCRDHV